MKCQILFSGKNITTLPSADLASVKDSSTSSSILEAAGSSFLVLSLSVWNFAVCIPKKWTYKKELMKDDLFSD